MPKTRDVTKFSALVPSLSSILNTGLQSRKHVGLELAFFLLHIVLHILKVETKFYFLLEDVPDHFVLSDQLMPPPHSLP